ncbi:MAG TPA: winged helix-turn-helix domain-containing protein, partial [Clostridia bacterium]|nr:winged helix-turn-helix domain-containing protein [Clostridia bacterium]
PGMVFSRDQLLNLVWDTDYAGDTRTVDMHIRTLRVKLGDAASLVQTVRGVGYRLSDMKEEGA